MTRIYKSEVATSGKPIITEHILKLTLEDLKIQQWEKDIIDCFTTEKSLLTPEDILVWIEYSGRARFFGTDISKMNNASQDTFKKDLKSTLRAAENHKRIKCAPFGN